MAQEFARTNGHGRIAFEGDLTVHQADEIRAVLIKALSEADHALLNVLNVTSADLACLQLLCSAHRTALQQGKQLSYEGAVPALVGKAVEEAGLSRSNGCCLDRTRTCIWVVK